MNHLIGEDTHSVSPYLSSISLFCRKKTVKIGTLKMLLNFCLDST